MIDSLSRERCAPEAPEARGWGWGRRGCVRVLQAALRRPAAQLQRAEGAPRSAFGPAWEDRGWPWPWPCAEGLVFHGEAVWDPGACQCVAAPSLGQRGRCPAPTCLPGSAWAPGKGRAVRAWVGEGGLVGFAWTQGQGVLGEPTFGSRGNAGGCGPAAANPIGPHTSALRPHVDFCLKNIGKCSKCGNCGPNEAHVGGGSRCLARPGQVALDPASPIRGSSQGPGALKAAGPKAA